MCAVQCDNAPPSSVHALSQFYQCPVSSIEANESEWGQAATESVAEWKDIDRKLRLIARKRSALDAAEAGLLRDADRVAIWQEFGCVSILDYMERVLGYGPQ